MEWILISVVTSIGLSEAYDYATSCDKNGSVEVVLNDGRTATQFVCLDDLMKGDQS